MGRSEAQPAQQASAPEGRGKAKRTTRPEARSAARSAASSPARPGRQLARGARTGALATLALLFVASAGLRAGDVMAERAEVSAAIEEAEALFAQRVGPELLEASATLRALEERESAVAAREAALEARAVELSDVEARLTERLAEIESAQAALEAAVAAARGAANEDVAHLATIYAQMKPSRASALFNEMDPRFAAGFLAEMAPQAAAAVLAGMTADKAYAASLILAARHNAFAGQSTDPEATARGTPQ
ncbi:MAG: hypothetical protein AAFQ88_12465 [Pseudomonadota bacterium]